MTPKKNEQELPVIVEEKDTIIANQLAKSGEFQQPRYSEKRDCFIFIRRK